MPRISTAGNTLAEYGLIGLLVLMVCGAALGQLGFSLHGQFNNFQQSLAFKPKPKATAPGSGNKIPVKNSPASFVAGTDGTLRNPKIFAPEGVIVSEVWTSPKETAQRIQVAGANGTTREMLASFEKWIQQMRDAGEIDDTQANKLQKMANDGHYLANAEKALEDALSQGQTRFTFEGKQYSAAQMAHEIGLEPDSGSSNWDLDPTYSKAIIAPLATSYQQAKVDGTLSNPVVKQKVSELMMQIAAASDALSWNTDVALKSGANLQSAQFNQTTASYFEKNLHGAVVKISSKATSASGLTRENSNQFCQMGSGKVQGQRCK